MVQRNAGQVCHVKETSQRNITKILTANFILIVIYGSQEFSF